MPGSEAGAFYVRLARQLVKLLQERTENGYVLSRRCAAAARPRLDSDRDLGPCSARLLRKPRPELGTRRHDQGARLRRRSRRPALRCCANLAPFVWRKYLDYRDARRHSRDEAADPRLSRPWRHRGRRPQHKARPWRHSRNRVFRPNPAADRRRPQSTTCAARKRLQPCASLQPAVRSTNRRAPTLDAAYRFLRTVEHRLQMVTDEQTHTLPQQSRRTRPLCAFSRLSRLATPSLATCFAT